MERLAARIKTIGFQVIADPGFLKSIDKWRMKQEDKPSRAQAIRRLVELGLKTKTK